MGHQLPMAGHPLCHMGVGPLTMLSGSSRITRYCFRGSNL